MVDPKKTGDNEWEKTVKWGAQYDDLSLHFAPIGKTPDDKWTYPVKSTMNYFWYYNHFVGCYGTVEYDGKKDAEHNWFITRVHDRNGKEVAQSEPLKHGDVIKFYNEKWPNASLYMKDDMEMGCDDEGLAVEWKVCKRTMLDSC